METLPAGFRMSSTPERPPPPPAAAPELPAAAVAAPLAPPPAVGTPPAAAAAAPGSSSFSRPPSAILAPQFFVPRYPHLGAGTSPEEAMRAYAGQQLLATEQQRQQSDVSAFLAALSSRGPSNVLKDASGGAAADAGASTSRRHRSRTNTQAAFEAAREAVRRRLIASGVGQSAAAVDLGMMASPPQPPAGVNFSASFSSDPARVIVPVASPWQHRGHERGGLTGGSPQQQQQHQHQQQQHAHRSPRQAAAHHPRNAVTTPLSFDASFSLPPASVSFDDVQSGRTSDDIRDIKKERRRNDRDKEQLAKAALLLLQTQERALLGADGGGDDERRRRHKKEKERKEKEKDKKKSKERERDKRQQQEHFASHIQHLSPGRERDDGDEGGMDREMDVGSPSSLLLTDGSFSMSEGIQSPAAAAAAKTFAQRTSTGGLQTTTGTATTMTTASTTDFSRDTTTTPMLDDDPLLQPSPEHRAAGLVAAGLVAASSRRGPHSSGGPFQRPLPPPVPVITVVAPPSPAPAPAHVTAASASANRRSGGGDGVVMRRQPEDPAVLLRLRQAGQASLVAAVTTVESTVQAMREALRESLATVGHSPRRRGHGGEDGRGYAYDDGGGDSGDDGEEGGSLPLTAPQQVLALLHSALLPLGTHMHRHTASLIAAVEDGETEVDGGGGGGPHRDGLPMDFTAFFVLFVRDAVTVMGHHSPFQGVVDDLEQLCELHQLHAEACGALSAWAVTQTDLVTLPPTQLAPSKSSSPVKAHHHHHRQAALHYLKQLQELGQALQQVAGRLRVSVPQLPAMLPTEQLPSATGTTAAMSSASKSLAGWSTQRAPHHHHIPPPSPRAHTERPHHHPSNRPPHNPHTTTNNNPSAPSLDPLPSVDESPTGFDASSSRFPAVVAHAHQGSSRRPVFDSLPLEEQMLLDPRSVRAAGAGGGGAGTTAIAGSGMISRSASLQAAASDVLQTAQQAVAEYELENERLTRDNDRMRRQLAEIQLAGAQEASALRKQFDDAQVLFASERLALQEEAESYQQQLQESQAQLAEERAHRKRAEKQAEEQLSAAMAEMKKDKDVATTTAGDDARLRYERLLVLQKHETDTRYEETLAKLRRKHKADLEAVEGTHQRDRTRLFELQKRLQTLEVVATDADRKCRAAQRDVVEARGLLGQQEEQIRREVAAREATAADLEATVAQVWTLRAQVAQYRQEQQQLNACIANGLLQKAPPQALTHASSLQPHYQHQHSAHDRTTVRGQGHVESGNEKESPRDSPRPLIVDRQQQQHAKPQREIPSPAMRGSPHKGATAVSAQTAQLAADWQSPTTPRRGAGPQVQGQTSLSSPILAAGAKRHVPLSGASASPPLPFASPDASASLYARERSPHSEHVLHRRGVISTGPATPVATPVTDRHSTMASEPSPVPIADADTSLRSFPSSTPPGGTAAARAPPPLPLADVLFGSPTQHREGPSFPILEGSIHVRSSRGTPQHTPRGGNVPAATTAPAQDFAADSRPHHPQTMAERHPSSSVLRRAAASPHGGSDALSHHSPSSMGRREGRRTAKSRRVASAELRRGTAAAAAAAGMGGAGASHSRGSVADAKAAVGGAVLSRGGRPATAATGGGGPSVLTRATVSAAAAAAAAAAIHPRSASGSYCSTGALSDFVADLHLLSDDGTSSSSSSSSDAGTEPNTERSAAASSQAGTGGSDRTSSLSSAGGDHRQDMPMPNRANTRTVPVASAAVAGGSALPPSHRNRSSTTATSSTSTVLDAGDNHWTYLGGMSRQMDRPSRQVGPASDNAHVDRGSTGRTATTVPPPPAPAKGPPPPPPQRMDFLTVPRFASAHRVDSGNDALSSSIATAETAAAGGSQHDYEGGPTAGYEGLEGLDDGLTGAGGGGPAKVEEMEVQVDTTNAVAAPTTSSGGGGGTLPRRRLSFAALPSDTTTPVSSMLSTVAAAAAAARARGIGGGGGDAFAREVPSRPPSGSSSSHHTTVSRSHGGSIMNASASAGEDCAGPFEYDEDEQVPPPLPLPPSGPPPRSSISLMSSSVTPGAGTPYSMSGRTSPQGVMSPTGSLLLHRSRAAPVPSGLTSRVTSMDFLHASMHSSVDDMTLSGAAAPQSSSYLLAQYSSGGDGREPSRMQHPQEHHHHRRTPSDHQPHPSLHQRPAHPSQQPSTPDVRDLVTRARRVLREATGGNGGGGDDDAPPAAARPDAALTSNHRHASTPTHTDPKGTRGGSGGLPSSRRGTPMGSPDAKIVQEAILRATAAVPLPQPQTQLVHLRGDSHSMHGPPATEDEGVHQRRQRSSEPQSSRRRRGAEGSAPPPQPEQHDRMRPGATSHGDADRSHANSTSPLRHVESEAAALFAQLEDLDAKAAIVHRRRAEINATLLAQRNQLLMRGAPDTEVERLNERISAAASKVAVANHHIEKRREGALRRLQALEKTAEAMRVTVGLSP